MRRKVTKQPTERSFYWNRLFYGWATHSRQALPSNTVLKGAVEGNLQIVRIQVETFSLPIIPVDPTSKQSNRKVHKFSTTSFGSLIVTVILPKSCIMLANNVIQPIKSRPDFKGPIVTPASASKRCRAIRQLANKDSSSPPNRIGVCFGSVHLEARAFQPIP